MSGDSIARTLEALLELHRRDQDGGDRLVRAVIRHARSLPPAEREELEHHLLSLVDAEDPRVWRVALEVLVRSGTPATASAFIPMIARGDRSPEWSDAVVIAMLRLGNPDAVAKARGWVREELLQHHPGALPLLGWLYRVDRDEAMEMATRFYAEVLGATIADAGIVAAVREQLPRQLEGLLAHSTSTVLDLVDRVAARDATAGHTLAALIASYLTAPDAPSRIGERAVETLANAIRRRA